MKLDLLLSPEAVAVGVFATLVLLVATGLELRRKRRVEPAVEPIVVPREAESSEALGRVAQALAGPRNPTERGQLRLRLVRAGYEGRYALEEYVALRAALALGLPLAMALTRRPESTVALLSAVLVLVTVGYYLPAGVLWLNLRERHEQLARSFPNALDMLVSCVEVGLAVDAALLHVARELSPAAPLLSTRLDQVNAELRAGVPRLEALQHFADRTGLDEAQSLVNLLNQAERYGAGIGQSLRAHSALLRRRRALEAEKRAAQATPKLTVVMILFILPPLFVVLLGPSIVNIAERLLPTLTGGAP